MAMKLYNESDIQNIADAIRDKNGTQDKYKVSEMAQAIEDISGGGDAYVFFQKNTSPTDLSQYSLEGLTELRNYAFFNDTNLANISLPSGLTNIGDYAFAGCPNLALTSLPSGLTSIGQYAFQNCTNLALTSLPSGLTSIGGSAFTNCANLALISLPHELTSIGQFAFFMCASLKTVLCNATNPPSLGSDAFASTHADLAIYVPDASVSAYQSAANWSKYASKIHPMSEYIPS